MAPTFAVTGLQSKGLRDGVTLADRTWRKGGEREGSLPPSSDIVRWRCGEVHRASDSAPTASLHVQLRPHTGAKCVEREPKEASAAAQWRCSASVGGRNRTNIGGFPPSRHHLKKNALLFYTARPIANYSSHPSQEVLFCFVWLAGWGFFMFLFVCFCFVRQGFSV